MQVPCVAVQHALLRHVRKSSSDLCSPCHRSHVPLGTPPYLRVVQLLLLAILHLRHRNDRFSQPAGLS
jgi:hypothetical protein